MPTRFDNRVNRHGPDRNPPTVRKVQASSVPFGSDICRNGRGTVWVAMEGDRLVAVGATSAEVRVKYREALRRNRPHDSGVGPFESRPYDWRNKGENVAGKSLTGRRNSFIYMKKDRSHFETRFSII